jgi:hypothetical protein
MVEKYDMAAKLVANMVAEELAIRRTWSINEALSRMAKTDLYERLMDSETTLWMDNPLDIADLFEKVFDEEQLDAADYFY